MRKLKVDDKVNIKDGSYAFGIENGRYTRSSNCDKREGLAVISTGLKTMRDADEERSGEYTQVCDLLVTDNDGGYWFTQSRFVEPVDPIHTIVIDGAEIEISDKSFKALKKQLGDC